MPHSLHLKDIFHIFRKRVCTFVAVTKGYCLVPNQTQRVVAPVSTPLPHFSRVYVSTSWFHVVMSVTISAYIFTYPCFCCLIYGICLLAYCGVQYFTILVVYEYSSSRIWGGGATGSDVTEVCSAHARIFPAFFSYYRSTKCSTKVPMAPGRDQRSRDPEGVPFGACMRNRKLCDICPSRAFSPVMTSVTWPRRGFPWVRTCATRSWGVPALFSGVFGYVV
jgi:hypothetical protein